MSTELICPECGGVIGGDSTDPGRACSCWAKNSEFGGAENGQASSGDTFVEKPDAPKAKVCCQCGKDLTGQRRRGDSRGYWCSACHKLDKEANKPKGERCEDCGRIVAEAALAEVDGKKICGICRANQKEAAREQRRLSPVKTSAHEDLAKRRLLWLLAA